MRQYFIHSVSIHYLDCAYGLSLHHGCDSSDNDARNALREYNSCNMHTLHNVLVNKEQGLVKAKIHEKIDKHTHSLLSRWCFEVVLKTASQLPPPSSRQYALANPDPRRSGFGRGSGDSHGRGGTLDCETITCNGIAKVWQRRRRRRGRRASCTPELELAARTDRGVKPKGPV